MKKSIVRLAAIVGVSALALAACGEAPSEESSESTGSSASTTADNSDFTSCMVSDAGGFDDKSFNETAYAGMTQAKEEFGISTNEIESNAESEYASNVQQMIDAGCDIIITVGFALAETTESAATQNPDIDFAIVDNASFEGVDNAKGLIFNTAEPAFMAGYLAAGMSESGKVGTFGGAEYPTVTIFMDGFAQGVSYYNEQKDAAVELIGWDEASQEGQFVGGNNPFGDIPGGKNTASTLIAQGADIIMPVAGPAGLGALQAAQESDGKVNAIWVDTDGYVSAPEYGANIISSVEKGMDVAVYEAIQASMNDEFDSEAYVGTLENGGASLAPFHDFDSEVPDELKAELEQIQADIISGDIEITSPSQP